MKPAITVQGLKKSYKTNAVLQGVDFTVEQGTIFALLGSNGAGKTTAINIMTTLIKADDGQVTVGGFDVARQPGEVRNIISLTGQFAAVDEALTAKENLVLIGELRKVKNAATTADKLLQQFNLVDAADRLAGAFSGGMRRRLDIAMSLIGDPAVIFLDEPTTGLDPQSRNAMWKIVQDLAHKGTTIFLTTQYLEEADVLADTIAVLHQGKIVAQATPEALKARVPQGQIILKFQDQKSLDAAAKLLTRLHTAPNAEALTLTVTTDGTVAELTHMLKQIEAAHIHIAQFTQKTPTLDDAFFTIINDNEGNK